MKYRSITDLTDEEVKFIVDDIYKPYSYVLIERKKDRDEIVVMVKEADSLRETIYLRDPFKYGVGFELTNNCFDYDYSEHEKRFEQFCLSKGVCYLLKDNPYLEAENE